ncbi:undecaprenyldiphospho-muramoylpentapeptide beta-N-acetylglucosaminyltransferase [Polycladomyces sp. WAk]|uniref:UDP-N-acetylglucosamine--N-acetylmuramyl-(pentapeptide) pyrophosphoryl-undecaprenol N-acetylglucosamine transferase n=2 Tax=Polycladomyces zharkentensis TaxID=2807616 RepID=A0ABS2WFS1_9BACL|nr:undecaprenyldiphospho-muramoylpentapeptide beta-N-acetylglucosaminyltransferase [Polycladomyces sp. WAk]MBN2908363.1 undecaprenyldiphospho-muramoylpentapeptide beta-N-acetylglucosaminyltransferase [Polycladomyces sp. WAk]
MNMKRILLSGGGTGGHIYPALAVMREVRKRYPDVEVGYIGTENGLESRIVTKEQNIRFFTVEIQGFRRKLTWENVQTISKFIRAVKKSKEYIREFQPDVVVGTGGYVCGPAVYAAHQLGIPTLIHEQNVIVGLTIRFLSRFADTVAISFEGTEQHLHSAKRVIHAGNPRATEVVHADAAAGMESLGLTGSDKPIVLFVGGSRGARPINEAVLQMVPLMASAPDIQFVYVTGEAHYDDVVAKVGEQTSGNLIIRPFLYNMPDVLAATSLFVGRAGASTLAELTALGLPSILIPSPYVTNNHQEANARLLEKKGAARVLLEKECSGETLFVMIQEILGNRERHQSMSTAARQLGRPDAAEVLVDELEQLVRNHKK